MTALFNQPQADDLLEIDETLAQVEEMSHSSLILEWAELTPCQRNEPDLWFAEQAAELERAKELCGSCPLAAACLEAALQREEPWGVWGGEILTDGQIVATKRGRGRPRKNVAA